MSANGPNVPVDSPRLAPPVTGLLAQVPVEVNGEALARWIAGAELRPESLANPEVVDVCVTLSLSSAHTGRPSRIIKPFALVLEDTCSTWGWREADYAGRASRALDVRRHYFVEEEFERGTIVAANPNLAQTYTAPTDPVSTTLLAGSARVSPTDALCLLDEAIAYSGIGRGYIHATPFLVGKWKAAGLLTVDGPREAGFTATTAALRALSRLAVDSGQSPALAMLAPLASPLLASLEDYAPGRRTQMWSPKGNLVIAGNGYKGYNPSGTLDSTHADQWAYATDPLAILASEPVTTPGTLAEATSRHTAIVTYRQDQMFAVLWPGLLHAAVKVATTTPAVP